MTTSDPLENGPEPAAKVEFRLVDPELYRHPGERSALARLKKIPGFSKALDMMSEGMGGKAERQTEIASMLRVGPGIYPVLYELWRDALGQFGLPDVPLHIGFHHPHPWSIRGGNDQPSVLLSDHLLTLLPEREMQALLAMQAGSIRLGNATYLAAADFLRWLSDFSGIAGAPAAMVAWGLENWRRYAAFSGDRAAALSMGDPDAVVALLERLSGGGSKAWGGVTEPDQIRIQGIEALSLEKDWSNSRWRRFAMAMNRQNHVGLIRRMDLLDWFALGEPARILSGELTQPRPAPESNDADPVANAEGMDDPGLAYWGEFAGGGCAQGDADSANRCPMAEVMGWAGKGLNTFWKAGEAFVKTLQDKNPER